MNLKIVFRENVHKLPDSIQNLNDLMEAFHNLYTIQSDVIVKVNNIDDDQESIIQNNEDFQKIIQLFKSHQKGIKFIIYEKDLQLNNFEEAVNNILGVTDQKGSLKTFQTLTELEFEQKQKGNIEIEKQDFDIKQSDSSIPSELQKSPIKEENFFSNLRSGKTFHQVLDEYFRSQLQLTGIFDSLKNSEKIINELQQNQIAADKRRMQMQHEIDELKAQIANPQEDKKYSADVQYNHQLNKVTNTIFNWPLNIKNSGDLHWEDNITISCVQGFQQGFVKPIHPLLPGQSTQIFIPIKCPTEPCMEESIWRLGYLRDNKQVYFGPIIVLQLNVESPQKIDQLHISPRLINLDQFTNNTLLRKALQIQEILQDEDINHIQKFILKNKFLYSDIHVIIEKYLDQNIKKKQGQKKRQK